MKLKFLIIYLSLFLIDIELTMATDLNCVQGIWKIKYDENTCESEYRVYKDHTLLTIYVYPSGKKLSFDYSTFGFFLFQEKDKPTFVETKSFLESNTGYMYVDYKYSVKQDSLIFYEKLNGDFLGKVDCFDCGTDYLNISCRMFMQRASLPSYIVDYMIAYRKDDLKYFGVEYEDHDVCSLLPDKSVYDLNFNPNLEFDASDILFSIIGKNRKFYKIKYESLDGKIFVGYAKKEDVKLK